MFMRYLGSFRHSFYKYMYIYMHLVRKNVIRKQYLKKLYIFTYEKLQTKRVQNKVYYKHNPVV